MQRAQGFAHDEDSPDFVAGATVTVYLAGTLTLASIYSDNGVTPKANPFTADASTGYWDFYAANDRYDVRFSGTVSPAWTLGDILLFDGQAAGSAYTFPSTPRASLPVAGTVGRTYLLTSDARNLVIDNGTTWEDVAGRVFSVRAYGAVGDGVANDTSPIQSAITAAVSAGAEVYFPPGTYKIDSPLTLGAASRIRGAGPNQSVITTHSLWSAGLDYLFTYSGSPANDYQQISIQGLALGLSNDAAFAGGVSVVMAAVGRLRLLDLVALNGSTHQLHLSGPIQARLQDCYASGTTGLYARISPGTDVAAGLVVQNCSFSSCPTFAIDYAGASNPGTCVIQGCFFDGCGTAANAATGTLYLLADSGATSRGAVISILDCYLVDCDGNAGIELQEPGNAGVQVVVERTLISGGTRTYGLRDLNTTFAARTDLLNCTFEDAGTADISIRPPVRGRILGCRSDTASISTYQTVFPDPTDSTINRTQTLKTEFLDPAAGGNASLGVGSAPDYSSGRQVAQFGPIAGADDATAWYFGILAALNATAASMGTGLAFTLQRGVAGAAQSVEIRATFRDDAGSTGAGGDYASIVLRKVAGADQAEISFNLTRSLGLDREVMVLDPAASANDTAIQIYSQVAGALVRVSTGGADSGGTGYRLLRIPN